MASKLYGVNATIIIFLIVFVGDGVRLMCG